MTSPSLPYLDRAQAGRLLAGELQRWAGQSSVLVLGLPRGGVITAEPVAEALDAPLDVLMVRKLGVPGQEELAMGAIATGGARVLHERVIEAMHISTTTLEQVTERETRELHRRQRLYRGDRPEPNMAGRCLILVDDGLATGSTMRAAARAVAQHHPAAIVIAVPVAPNDTAMQLQQDVDELICPATPEPFYGVGQWYQHFEQVTDQQVRDVLTRAWQRLRAGDN